MFMLAELPYYDLGVSGNWRRLDGHECALWIKSREAEIDGVDKDYRREMPVARAREESQ